METCTEVYRIPAKKIPNKPLREPTLVVAFKGYEDRNILFQSLKNLKELTKIQKFCQSRLPENSSTRTKMA
jgi:hypothetical protein